MDLLTTSFRRNPNSLAASFRRNQNPLATSFWRNPNFLAASFWRNQNPLAASFRRNQNPLAALFWRSQNLRICLSFCLRARLQPCRKRCTFKGALAPEVTFLAQQLFQALCPTRES
jgi:hypothetical protein